MLLKLLRLARKKEKKTAKYIIDLDFFLLISIKVYFAEIKMEKGYSHSERLGSLPPILKDPKFS